MNLRALIFVLVGAALLGGLFWVMKPQQAVEQTTPATTAASSVVSAAPAVPRVTTHRFEFTIQAGKKTSGPEVMAVQQGDEVTLLLVADSADEAHLHGYDLEAELKPRQAAALTFKAERSGRFTLELHHGHTEISALEVQPH